MSNSESVSSLRLRGRARGNSHILYWQFEVEAKYFSVKARDYCSM